MFSPCNAGESIFWLSEKGKTLIPYFVRCDSAPEGLSCVIKKPLNGQYGDSFDHHRVYGFDELIIVTLLNTNSEVTVEKLKL